MNHDLEIIWKVAVSFDTLVPIYQTTRFHIPEDDNLKIY
jgi:hypothetical protein